MEAVHYFIRHGQEAGNRLTGLGKEQSKQVVNKLLSSGIGNTAIVLSSDETRALETAEIIAGGLGAAVHESRRLAIAGQLPAAVKDLDVFLKDTLEQSGLKALGHEQKLVVVAHAPLLAVIKGLQLNDASNIENGEIIEYVPGSWDTSYYDERYAMLLDL